MGVRNELLSFLLKIDRLTRMCACRSQNVYMSVAMLVSDLILEIFFSHATLPRQVLYIYAFYVCEHRREKVGPLDFERHFCTKCKSIGLRRKTEYRRLRHRRESSWKRSPNCSGMYDLRLKASLSCSTLVIHTESICGSLMGSRELFHAPLPIWYKLIIISFEILFQPHALASPNEATLLGFHLDFLREETVLDPCHSPLKHIHFRIRVQWHCWQSGHTRKHRIAQLSSSLQSIATKLCSLIL